MARGSLPTKRLNASRRVRPKSCEGGHDHHLLMPIEGPLHVLARVAFAQAGQKDSVTRSQQLQRRLELGRVRAVKMGEQNDECALET